MSKDKKESNGKSKPRGVGEREYFVPQYLLTVKATSPSDALKKAEAISKLK